MNPLIKTREIRYLCPSTDKRPLRLDQDLVGLETFANFHIFKRDLKSLRDQRSTPRH